MERRDRRHVRAQRDEHRLEREQDQEQDGQPNEPPRHPPDQRDHQQDERQPAEHVAEVPMGDERARVVEDAEAGEEDLDDRAGDEQPGDDGIGGACHRPSHVIVPPSCGAQAFCERREQRPDQGLAVDLEEVVDALAIGATAGCFEARRLARDGLVGAERERLRDAQLE